jgi:hypothetical protein
MTEQSILFFNLITNNCILFIFSAINRYVTRQVIEVSVCTRSNPNHTLFFHACLRTGGHSALDQSRRSNGPKKMGLTINDSISHSFQEDRCMFANDRS